jgi:hypothetical protein
MIYAPVTHGHLAGSVVGLTATLRPNAPHGVEPAPNFNPAASTEISMRAARNLLLNELRSPSKAAFQVIRACLCKEPRAVWKLLGAIVCTGTLGYLAWLVYLMATSAFESLPLELTLGSLSLAWANILAKSIIAVVLLSIGWRELAALSRFRPARSRKFEQALRLSCFTISPTVAAGAVNPLDVDGPSAGLAFLACMSNGAASSALQPLILPWQQPLRADDWFISVGFNREMTGAIIEAVSGATDKTRTILDFAAKTTVRTFIVFHSNNASEVLAAGGRDLKPRWWDFSPCTVVRDGRLSYVFCPNLQQFVSFLSPPLVWGLARGLMLAFALALEGSSFADPQRPAVGVACNPLASAQSAGLYSVDVSNPGASCEVTADPAGFPGALEVRFRSMAPEGSGRIFAQGVDGELPPAMPFLTDRRNFTVFFKPPQDVDWPPAGFEIEVTNRARRSSAISVWFRKN